MHASLVLVNTVAPQSAQCPAGGIQLISGIDTNNDGKLDDNEILNTSYLCNGAAAMPGANATALVRVVPEPAGAHCADGGSAVESGLDSNGDGKLEDSEVTSTSYACNGESGVLVRVVAEAAGSHCLRGGSAVLSGLDSNHDGKLEDGEVTNTSYICDPVPTVLTGDITINSAADLTQLTNVPRIEGNLVVKAPDVTLLYLPDLVEIAGGLTVTSDAKALTAVRLPRLVTIAGALDISPPAGTFTELTLTALTSASSFHVDSASLTTLSADALTNVPGAFYLGAPSMTTAPTLFALVRTGAATLTNCGFNTFRWPPSWREIDGDLSITSATKLTSLSLGPVDVRGQATISAATVMTTFSFTGSVDGVLEISNHPALTTIKSWPRVGGLVMQNDTALTTLSLNASLGNSLSTLEIVETPALTAIQDLGTIGAIDKLDVETGSLTTLSVPHVVDVGSLWVLASALPQCWKTKLEGQLTVKPATDEWLVSNTVGTCQ